MIPASAPNVNLNNLLKAASNPEKYLVQIDKKGSVGLYEKVPPLNLTTVGGKFSFIVSPRSKRKKTHKFTRKSAEQKSPSDGIAKRKGSRENLTDLQVLQVLLGIADTVNGRKSRDCEDELISSIVREILQGKEKIRLKDCKNLDAYPGTFADRIGLITQGTVFEQALKRRVLGSGKVDSAGMDLGRLIFGENIRLVLSDESVEVTDKAHHYKLFITLAKECGVSNAILDQVRFLGRQWTGPEDVRKWIDKNSDNLGNFMRVVNALSQITLTSCASVLTKTLGGDMLGEESEENPVSLRDLHNKGAKADQGRMVHVDFSEKGYVRIQQEMDFYSSAKRVFLNGKWCEPREDRGLVIRVEAVYRAHLEDLADWGLCKIRAEVNEFLSIVDKKTIHKAQEVLRQRDWQRET